MRLPIVVVALPALILAQSQKPFKDRALDIWAKASSLILPAPLPSAAVERVAIGSRQAVIEDITADNWRGKLLNYTEPPFSQPKEWMILFSGNNSCLGKCQSAEIAFNVTKSPRPHPHPYH